MAGLQRSAMSFRRQGSSGLVWDDKLLSAELNHQLPQKQQDPTITAIPNFQQDDQQQLRDPSRTVGSISTIERSRSNGGGRAFRTGKVSPAIDPPSPKVSSCGFCTTFGKPNKTRRRPTPGKRST